MLTNIVTPRTRRQHAKDMVTEDGQKLDATHVREAGKHAMAGGKGPADLPMQGETYSKGTHLDEEGLLRGGIPHNRRGRMPRARSAGSGAPAPVAPMPDPSALGGAPDVQSSTGMTAPTQGAPQAPALGGGMPGGGGFKRGGRIC